MTAAFYRHYTFTMDRMTPIEEAVAQLAEARPTLVDRWEAAAVLESLGYTDARVKSELGFSDTLALATHAYQALAQRVASDGIGAPRAEPERPLRDFANAAGLTLVYAVPWIAVVAAAKIRPALLHLPSAAIVPLTLALVASLVVSGGFVQALSRVGRFYVAINQPDVALATCIRLLRAGIVVTVAVAAAAGAALWFVRAMEWPYVVLGLDAFIVLSAFWMACAILTLKQAHWRVLLAFGAAGAGFLLVHAFQGDALSASLIAAAALIATALVQIGPAIGGPRSTEPPLPAADVVFFRALPHFVYGLLYFLFLGSHALLALGAGDHGLTPDTAGIAVALMTFLIASVAVEYANLRFGAHARIAMQEPLPPGPDATAVRMRALRRRALVTGCGGYLAVALALGTVMFRIPSADFRVFISAWLPASIGYFLLAIGAMNALMLITLNEPWSAASAFAAGAIVMLAGRGNLIAGALFIAGWSWWALSDRLRRPDYALAAF